MSETGSLEFFIFSSTTSDSKGFNRFKKVQKDLAIISGFVPLPPIYTLGFHFSKYASVSADIMMQRNKDFTSHGFPVDVLWIDIQWADQNS